MLIKFILIINKIFIKEINPLKYYFLFFLILLSIVNRSYAENNEVLLWKTSAGNSYSTRFFEGERDAIKILYLPILDRYSDILPPK